MRWFCVDLVGNGCRQNHIQKCSWNKLYVIPGTGLMYWMYTKKVDNGEGTLNGLCRRLFVFEITIYSSTFEDW